MDFIDLTSFRCPIPLVRIKLILRRMAVGETLQILLSDSGSRRDVPLFLQKQGHRVDEWCNDATQLGLRITKQEVNRG
ncbi:sulfurtransferase TusA family protein [Shewanella sp.]|uniref:sulfurtransferase TusA family protein n=1 Tax=Shewanella sp. TaxID=50422 RepID=UPI003F3E73CA